MLLAIKNAICSFLGITAKVEQKVSHAVDTAVSETVAVTEKIVDASEIGRAHV